VGSPKTLIGGALDAGSTADRAILTEGILDLLSLEELTLGPCFSLPRGAGSLGRAGKKPNPIAAHLAKLASWAKTWVLATDGDDAGDKAADRAVEVLFEAGAESVRRVRYPRGCKDANEVLVQHGPDAVRALIDEAEPIFPANHPGSWADPAELVVSDQPYLVDGLIREGSERSSMGRKRPGRARRPTS
jgi:twinkle protein